MVIALLCDLSDERCFSIRFHFLALALLTGLEREKLDGASLVESKEESHMEWLLYRKLILTWIDLHAEFDLDFNPRFNISEHLPSLFARFAG